MKYTPEIAGAIFDLDGTLLDSMKMWRTLGIRYLSSKGVSDTETITEEIRYLDLIPASEFMAKKYLPKFTGETIYAEIREMLRVFYEEEVQMKSGAIEYLNYLREHEIKMSVATATDREFFMPALRRLGADSFFEGYITNVEVGRGKHFPDIYDAACDLIGSPREKTSVYEDIFVGANTAKNAGYKVIGVYESVAGQQERNDLMRVADYYVERLDMLI